MKCIAPLKLENGKVTNIPVRCRKCIPCKILKRREWTARIVLESLVHDKSCFVTLTYSDNNLPGIDKHPGGNLIKRDLQLFIKRLRYHAGNELRYFACGEYGNRNQRAHYHAIIFGLDESDTDLIQKSWPEASHGFSMVGTTTIQSAQYVAQYVTKKIDDKDQQGEEHYAGRQPEFMLSSRIPGLGDPGAEMIAETLTFDKPRNFILDGVIRIKGRRLPLDNFMKNRITHYMIEMGATEGLLVQPHEVKTLNEQLEARHESEKQTVKFKKQFKENPAVSG